MPPRTPTGPRGDAGPPAPPASPLRAAMCRRRRRKSGLSRPSATAPRRTPSLAGSPKSVPIGVLGRSDSPFSRREGVAALLGRCDQGAGSGARCLGSRRRPGPAALLRRVAIGSEAAYAPAARWHPPCYPTDGSGRRRDLKRSTFFCGVLLLASLPSGARNLPNDAPDAPPSESRRACGHVRELQEAKRALSEGDRERALDHLRRARRLAAECARSVEDPAGEGGGAASAYAEAPTAAPDAEPTAPARTRPLRGSDRSARC